MDLKAVSDLMEKHPAIEIGIGIVAGVLLLGLILMVTLALKQGRSIKIFGFELGDRKKEDTVPSTVNSKLLPIAALGHQKLLYVKIVHLRRRMDGIEPVYRFKLEGEKEVQVYDETVFYVLHLFKEPQKLFRWSVVTSGSAAVPRIIYPWQEAPTYFDPRESAIWEHRNPIADEPSAIYQVVTHMYNGLQPGHEEVYAKVEQDADFVRVTADFSSLADPKPQFKRRPEGVVRSFKKSDGWRIVSAQEVYPSVFTVTQTNLKVGQSLAIQWEMAW